MSMNEVLPKSRIRLEKHATLYTSMTFHFTVSTRCSTIIRAKGAVVMAEKMRYKAPFESICHEA